MNLRNRSVSQPQQEVGECGQGVKPFRLRALYQSPLLLLVVIAASIFLSELLVMLFLSSFLPLSAWGDSVLDALLLIVLLSPILYFSLFRPLVHHIAERKRAEDALRERESFLETIIESEPECVKLLAPDGTVIRMNRAGLDMIQADSLEQVKGQSVYPLVVPEYREAFRTLTQDVFHGKSGRLEFPIVGLRGRRLWLETCAVPLRSETGEITALLGITRNVTEHKRAEEALRESEEMYRLLFKKNPVPMWVYDTETLFFVAVNEAAVSHYGYSRDEFLSMTVKDIRPSEEISRFLEILADPDTGPARSGVWKHRKKDGTICIVETFAHRIALGERPARLVLANDITERKLAEDKLKESEARLAEAQKIAKIGNWDWDIAKNTLWWSDETCRIFEVNPREFGGTFEAFVQSLHSEDRKRVRTSVDDAIRNKISSWQIDYRIALANGKVRFAHQEAKTIFGAEGGSVRWIGTVQDVTELKQAEEQLLNVARGVSASAGEMFFRSLTEHVAKALDVDCAFIGEMIKGNPNRIRTIAMYADGKIADNVEYDLAGTPCENVAGKSLCTYPSGVQRLFPLDPLVGEMGIQSYSGMPLFDSAGKALGILAVLHRQPLRDSTQLESMIRIFATRAAAELERSNAEKELGKKSLQLTMNLEAQSAINALLQVSLEDNSLDEILGRALDQVLSMSWLPAEAKGAIFLVGDDPDTLDLKAMRGFGEHMSQKCKRISFGQCLCGRAASAQEVQFADSVDDRHEIRYDGMKPHGQYCVPILSSGKTLGVLNLHLEEGHKRDGKDEDFLRAIASALAGIIQRKHMKEEKEKLIGELKDLIATVSRSQREWLETFDSITDVIFLSDMDFNIVRVNRAVEKMLGIPLIQLLGRKCHELFHGSTFAPEFCLGCQPLEKGKTASVEMFEPHLNKFIEVRVIPRFDRNDTLLGLIHVIRDITEQKELEDQLRHAQKMEAVGQLAGGIAHDFNNILTGIISCGNLLEMKLETETPLKTYIDYILDASQRGASLVRGLLAFSRKEMLYSSPVNLNEIITGLEPLIQKTITEDIGLRMELADEVLTVMADKTQIEQVLINLVANARDAMSAGGEIAIHTERLSLGDDSAQVHGSLKPGVYAFMSVSDTGMGMDEKTRERIFEPFFTTKEVGKGTGLGLSIVYGIVKQHEGFISIDSLPGRGTTVKIYLPLVPEDLERREEEEPLLPEGGTETLLFAEDDSAVRGIVKNLLEEFGYAVIDAVDGDDAVTKFIEHQDAIRLVVLDVIMPRMNGKEAYEKIKGMRPDVKTVFMSGYASDVLQSKFILEDGLHFLQKPVSPATLLRKIREVLDA